jgi:hypothetical protein
MLNGAKSIFNYLLKGQSHEIGRYVFWCHSIDLNLLPLTEPVYLILKFCFLVEFFDFRISAQYV